jgi:DNA polymerase-3 subunit alpha
MFVNLDTLTKLAAAESEQRDSSQISMFGGAAEPPVKLENAQDWSQQDRLSQEFDAIGFYLSAHPLDAYAKGMKRLGVIKSTEVIKHLKGGGKGRIKMAGTLLSKQERVSAKGNRYAFVTLSDATGMFEATCFSEVLNASRDLFESGVPLLLEMDAKIEDDQVRLMCQHVFSLDAEVAKAAAGIKISIRDPSPLPQLKSLIAGSAKGRIQVIIVSKLEDREVEAELKEKIQMNATFMSSLRSMPGIVEVEEI